MIPAGPASTGHDRLPAERLWTAVDSLEPQPSKAKRRRRFPRFGLRSLLVFALLFCIFFAWIGRNAYRVRQEEAAIEVLKQGGARIVCETDVAPVWPQHLPVYEIDRRAEAFSLSRLLGFDGLPGIREVHLEQFGRRDDGALLAQAKALATFPEIHAVTLEGPGYGKEEFAALRSLNWLESITLLHADVAAEGLASLGPPLRVRELLIDRNERTSPGALTGLASWDRLQSVQIRGLSISREDVEALASLPNLEALVLERVVPHGDDCYAPLAELRNCATLVIVDSGFQNGDVGHLPKDSPLRTLTLEGIADVGLFEFDPPSTLRSLTLCHPVSPFAAEAFSADRPALQITYYGKGGSAIYFPR